MQIRHARALAVVPALLAFPAAAAATPSLATDHQCYAEGETMTFTGQGFTPGAKIGLLLAANGRVGTSETTADVSGAFSLPLRAPKLKDFKADPPSFSLGVTANDESKINPDGSITGPPEEMFAPADIRISEFTVDVPPWDRSGASARAGQRVKLTTHGWTNLGDTLYVHYLRGGKAVHSEKVGPLKAPCGDLTKNFKAFAFKGAKPGTYAVRFSASPKWSGKDPWLGYRAVRLAA